MNIPNVNNEFSTLEALEKAAQAAAKVQGFAFSRCSSNLDGNNSKSPYIILQYTKGGNWRNNWSITSKSLDNGGIVLPKNVVNKWARIRYALNEGSNADSAQKLLCLCQQCDYMIKLLKTPDGHLTHLFFSHIEAAKHTTKYYEVLIVDATYKTNVYKFPLVSAVSISNITNEKGSLKTFQIAIAWMENENEDSYKWFLISLRKKVYDAYNCLPCVFMSDRDQALRNASRNDDDYIEFKKEVMALQLSSDEESIITAMKSIKIAAEKAHDPKKPLAYIDTLMKDSKFAFKQAIETASGLESVFENINQKMQVQNLKTAIYTSTNKVAIKNLLIEIQENSTKYNEATTCQCQIRINYTLLFYHTVSKDGPIPLNIIDKRWYLYRPDIKDLPSPSLELLATNPEFYKAFLKAENTFCQLSDDASIKAEFIACIHQVATMPLSEPLKAPKIKVLKGRHSGTKHEKLLSEKQDIEAKKKKDIDIYEDSVPKFMKEFILSFINVHGNGNCGFRAIAVSLEMSEDEWPTWKKGPCGVENWMLMPSFGYPIANAFRRPIHYFSKHQCLTFLPDNIPLNRNQSIVFAFIDKQNNYIAMRLKPNAPVPKAFEKEDSLYSKDQATSNIAINLS
ncbi:40591_t:CDS:2 [Gigaspora margarita]|uniref:40591_t:CDS:1 n=1 Tax=Gigaspora margarita TaxID=4874 RepID=A0ABN7VWA3_GIGMA|nr:40591_t:CDS:2 [Gigaspora margarita]